MGAADDEAPGAQAGPEGAKGQPSRDAHPAQDSPSGEGDAAADPWLRAAPPVDPMDLSPWSTVADSDASAPDGFDRTGGTDDGTGSMDAPDEVWLRLDLALPAISHAPEDDTADDDTDDTAADDAPPAAEADDADADADAITDDDRVTSPPVDAEPSPFADPATAEDASPFADPDDQGDLPLARGPAPGAPGDAAPDPDMALLAPAAGQGAGFFGKLPLRGDFIARGVPRPVLRPLETWLEQVMAGLRSDLGPGWQTDYDAAAIWHFWIGPAVFGTTLTGALMASADRVGRRFPALIVLADPPGDDTGQPLRCPPPPATAPRHAWHEACATLLRRAAQQTDLAAFEAALDRLAVPEPADPGMAALIAAPQRALWAQTAGGDLHGLIGDIRAGEAHLAAAGRSYWWTGHPGDGSPPALIALDGVPDAQIFGFLLRAAPMQPLANGDGSA